MADRPIIFSAPMVRALLAGQKTMTRRLAWRVPIAVPDDAADYWRGRGARVSIADDTDTRLAWLPSHWQRVQPGDRLWVKERASWPRVWDTDPDRVHIGRIFYEAAAPFPSPEIKAPEEDHGRLKAAMHLPRRLSRLTLAVTAVRVERLRDVTEADAVAEGVRLDRQGHPSLPWSVEQAGGCPIRHTSAVGCFAGLWNSLHGADAWASNPAVVAITFSVARRNIDGEAAGHGG